MSRKRTASPRHVEAAGPAILWLDSEAATGLPHTGGKGANLARLVRLGVPVPPGFVVTTDSYRATIVKNGLLGAEPEVLRARLPEAEIPTDIARAVIEGYKRLGAGAVAVRSSATAEDLPDASFAGQHDTLLDVTGSDALLAAVRSCWASLWSPRAVDYRARQGWDGAGLALAVVVQVMVPAEWAGVLFTVDPVTGSNDRILIEAVAGLGESLVSGQASGKRQTLDKVSLRRVEGQDPLPEGVAAELGRLATTIEVAFGGPQDIEWAHADGRTYIVQARPVTALPSHVDEPARRPAQRRLGRLQRAAIPSVMEHLPVPPYPLDLSIFFRPLWGRLLDAAPRLGIRLPASGAMFTELAEDVVQIVPPTIRPTLRALGLPVTLAQALRADPRAWLEDARGLVDRAHEMERDDLASLPDPEIVARIRELSCRQLELAVTRFGPFPAGLLATAALGFHARRAVGERADEIARDLVAGVASVTTRANGELRKLAGTIRASDELRTLFASAAPDALAARLGDLPGAMALRSEIDGFLERYGSRETALPSVGYPSWRDDPTVVYGLLKGLVAGDIGVGDPSAELARAKRAEHAVVAGLSHSWFGLRRLLVPFFRRSLRTTRAFVAYREDSHFLLFAPFTTIRRLALELGRRLTEQGALQEPTDVFFLHLDELVDLTAASRMQVVVQRRREARRGVEKGYTTVPLALLTGPEAGAELRGTPVSGGQAAGLVRIIVTERDFWKLERGEVLVARYTNPSWTPLFAIAAAVVVEAGGAASHAAIVAREYRLPAVMGATGATARFVDGDRVLVDGTAGRVSMIARASRDGSGPESESARGVPT
jgi:phosphohistidine swiveling domain-containing protein